MNKQNNAKSLLGGAIIVTSDNQIIVKEEALENANRLLDDVSDMAVTSLNEKSADKLSRTVVQVTKLLSRYNEKAYKSASNTYIAVGLLMLLHDLTCNLMNVYEEASANNGDEGEGNIDPNGNIIVDDDDNPF